MFEAALLTTLQNDSALTALLSTYGGAPAIFSDMAPESAEQLYLVFSIDREGDENIAAQAFTVTLDLYDHDVSRVNIRAASERIEFVLDRAELTDPSGRYDTIRLFFLLGRPVLEGDSRKAHHQIQFTARAGRKAWAAQL